jgi:hypothetical protein
MNRLPKRCGVGLAILTSLPLTVFAQVPQPLPGVPGGTAGPVAPLAPVIPTTPPPPAPIPATAPPRNIWTFLCLSPEQRARCKAKFCASQFGQLTNNSLAPVAALTGGVIPQCCPDPNQVNPADLARPPDSALGAAARIKEDAAAAAARRAAVAYLSTVDCNWWPEAQAALINSLRADRNECVRLEAALALQRGCCCSKETIAALALTVSGSRADSNPAEDSVRVKLAAVAALEHCLACYVNVVPAPPAPPPPAPVLPKEGPAEGIPPPRPVPPVPVPPPPPATGPALTSRPLFPAPNPRSPFPAYYQRVGALSRDQVAKEGLRILRLAQESRRAALAAAAAAPAPHALSDVIREVVSGTPVAH